MKKGFLLLGIGALMLASCSGNKEQLEQDSIKIAQLTADYNQAATFNDSLMLLMGDIYNGLDSINMQEGLLYNMGAGENSNRRAEIRNNLSAIKSRLAANRQLLEEMSQKLKNSGNQNSVLSRTIEQLQTRLDQQDQKIVRLEKELTISRDSIGYLNRQVAETRQQVEEETEAKEIAQAAYENADNQLNTVYYAIGTKKELEKNDIIEKKFLRSTKVMRGDFNEAYFTKADKRNLLEIPTYSKKVKKIWTNMPQNSYQIVTNDDKTQTIKITNPTEFWSLSPYLVIEVDK